MVNYQRWDKRIPYQLTRGVLKLYLNLFRLRYKVGGAGPLPPGPKIMALNHCNASDGFHIPLAFSERFFTLIQGNMFDVPVIGWLLSKSDQIPVIAGRKLEAFRKACEVLSEGHTVLIFPEGILNPDQSPLKAGSGAVCLSLKTGAPIVPVGTHVADQDTLSIEYWKKNIHHIGRWQIRGCCYIQVGQPWYPAREEGLPNKPTAQGLTEMLMSKIYALSALAGAQARSDHAIPQLNPAFE